ncbi:hypothetical protein P7C70_g4207, partial [Phenoliferia sp. Uapishka_3]
MRPNTLRATTSFDRESTFPHLLFQTYPTALPFPPSNTPAAAAQTSSSAQREPTTAQTSLAKVYIPRIYGFKVSERARSGPRMQWLRMRPRTEGELDWKDDDLVPTHDDESGAAPESGDLFGDKPGASDNDDDSEEEEEEEEEQGGGGGKAMKMSGVVGTPPTGIERGRTIGEEQTLMNSRVYRPLPAARTSLPTSSSIATTSTSTPPKQPTKAATHPLPSSASTSVLQPPPPAATSSLPSPSVIAPVAQASTKSQAAVDLAEAVRRDVKAALPRPPQAAHFATKAPVLAKGTVV